MATPSIKAPHFHVCKGQLVRVNSGELGAFTEGEQQRKQTQKERLQKSYYTTLKERQIFQKEKDIRTFLDLKTFKVADQFFRETMITTTATVRHQLESHLQANIKLLGEDYEIDSVAQQVFISILTGQKRELCEIGSGSQGVIFKVESPLKPSEEETSLIALKVSKNKDYNSSSSEVWFARRRVSAFLPVSCVERVDVSDQMLSPEEVNHALCMELGEESVEAFFRDEENSLGSKLKVFLQIAEKLSKLHHKYKLSHHDLKPANIVLKEGEVFFIDSANVCEFGDRKKDNIGTMVYASPPEIFKGEYTVDHTFDMWSMGIMLVRLITNKLPLSKMGDFALMKALNENSYKDKIFCKDLSETWKVVTSAFRSVIEKALNVRNPNFPSVALDLLIMVKELKQSKCLELTDSELEEKKQNVNSILTKQIDQISFDDLTVILDFLDLKPSMFSGNFDSQLETMKESIKIIQSEMKLRQYPELRALCVKLLDDNPAKRGTSNDLILALDKFLVDHPELLEEKSL